MSDTLRARRRRSLQSARRWTTAAVAAGMVIATAAQADAASAGTAKVQAASTHTHGSAAARAAAGLAADTGQGSPTYYDSGLDPTPYMGWNTYYALGGAPTESSVENVADFLLSSGLASSGYDYVWLDGGWQASTPRNAQGELVANPTEFPDGIAALAGWLHARGLKLGIYTDAGVYNSADCGLASGGHYQQDADEFASWGVDAIKVDFLCGIAEDMDPGPAYAQFSQAVAQSGRKMLLNLCNPLTSDWGEPNPSSYDAWDNYTFGPTLADSWRTDTDIAYGTPTAGEFPYVLRNIDDNEAHPEAEGPGHYNDPDYLLPMRQLSGGGYELDETQSTSQFEMWAEMGSPLVLGSDPRTLPTSMLDVLENPEILAVDQDPLDIQGVAIDSTSTGTVYSKVLSGSGRRAVVLLNRSDTAQSMSVQFAQAGLSGSVSVRDLTARQGLGSFTTSYTTTVPADGTAMLLLTGTDALPGSSLGGQASADPALVHVNDADSAAFVRGADGGPEEQTTTNSGAWSGTWTELGGPTGGEIVGQPAAYANADGSLDVFVLGTDAQVYRNTFADGAWQGWSSLGGSLADAPTVAYTGPNAWTLVGTGTDGQIWTLTATGGWSALSPPTGLSVYGRPSAVTDGTTTYVAVRTDDDSVWLDTSSAAGQWSGWTGLGGTVSDSPTLLETEGRVYLFARASDYTTWEDNLTSGSWSGWFERAEFTSDVYNGSFGAAAGDDGHAWITYRGIDGQVHLIEL
ncbi:glycoside hydrolase family 27 protein [Actinospica durhamensis]|uniref:Alpha-galactosidase n=1 Tax=Actinospica durhamensis TaxID=1508375 RepID=A0A941EJP1_9ACTN|nr:glycoside hydrolase family 27 protein [Actinospica durhamensis]MBR7832088.1 glycoside hydrolase family 27 protein [Actinospica durhamensis]